MGKPIEALRFTLQALHLAPTAPDTLAVQSTPGNDPFVIDTVPHVLFSGGHDYSDTCWVGSSEGNQGTTCICVPAFHRQPSLVLVNLHQPREVLVHQFGNA